MPHCRYCGNEIDDIDKYCFSCGESLKGSVEQEKATTYCQKCGSEMGKEDNFCQKCEISTPGEERQLETRVEEEQVDDVKEVETEEISTTVGEVVVEEKEPPEEKPKEELDNSSDKLVTVVGVGIGCALIGILVGWLIGNTSNGVPIAEWNTLVHQNQSWQTQYDELEADYDNLNMSYFTMSQELSALNKVNPPRYFSSTDELREWLTWDETSERPARESIVDEYFDAIDIQKNALEDGYLISSVFEYRAEEDSVAVYSQAYIELIQDELVGKPWLGVATATVDESIIENYSLPIDVGVYVSEVIPRSPAEEAGLAIGDIIVIIGNEIITSNDVLTEVIFGSALEQVIEITFWREDVKYTTVAELASRPPMEGGLVWWYPWSDSYHFYPLE